MKIKKMKVNDIKLAEYNPRKITEEQAKKLVNSIEKFGYIEPIVVNKQNNVVVGGNQRLKALKTLKPDEEIEVVLVDLPQSKEKALNIALNKISGDWDFDKLEDILKELSEEELELTGFDDKELSKLLQKEAFEDDFDTESSLNNPKYEVKIGDIFKLGNHRLMCGDSTKKEDVDKLYNEEIKLIFTSPPYNMNAKMYDNYMDNMESEEYIKLNIDCLNILKDKLKGFVFWNLSYNRKTRWEFMEIFNRIRKEVNLIFLELICWNKKSALPIRSNKMLTRIYEDIALFGSDDMVKKEIEYYYLGTNEIGMCFNKHTFKGISNYWEITVNNVQLDNHKACYPVKLVERGIKLLTNENDVVADPFGGSGTTLIACEQLDRKCYMMELDPIYCSVIIERWEKLTGNEAEKL